MRGLKDKVVLVTGAASGIGAATARRFDDEGSIVVVADINIDGARRVAGTLSERARSIAFDATDEDSVHQLIDQSVAAFGRIDVLHNNAGAVAAGDTTVTDTPVELWDKAMALNSRAYFAAAKYAIPHMIGAGGGVIVNTASSAAFAAQLAQTAYGASKAGIIALTKYIVTQYGRQGIRANSVSPGLVVTPGLIESAPELVDAIRPLVLTPTLGEPDDIAATVAFLASDDARYITGQNICIDGGLFTPAPYAQQ